MSAEQSTILALSLSLLLFGLITLRRGIRDPLVCITGFYLLFAFGPVINHLSGASIYFGIKTEYIDESSWIFFLATLGLCLPAWLIPLDASHFKSVAGGWQMANILRPAHMVMCLLGTGMIGRYFISGGNEGNKVQSIALMGGGWHYLFLLVELYLTAFYFHMGTGGFNRFLRYLNFALYVSYCLLLGERDFVFVLLSLMLHHFILNPKRATLKLTLSIFVLATLSVAIFFFRDRGQAFMGVSSLLNQGSLLLVNSFVLFLLDHGQAAFWGQSYVNAIINLLPSGLGLNTTNMPEWFRSQYAAHSASGYGFGLDAEGYLNFYWPGVFLTFLLIGLLQRKVFNLRQWPSFSVYYSVFFVGFAMYAIRNDSTAFLKGNLYAIVSFLSLQFISRMMGERHGS